MTIFPPPEKGGQIKFIIARSLPYRARLLLLSLALLCGLAAQMFFSFWLGLAIFVFASLLGAVKGYDATPKTEPGSAAWTRVTPDEYTKIKTKAEELNRWDEDFFDCTNKRGVTGIAVFGALLVILYCTFLIHCEVPPGYGVYMALDAAVLLVPLWFSGVREYLRKDGLVIKIKVLEDIMARLAAPSDVQVFPMLSLAKTLDGKTEPEDARLLVRLLSAPKEFMGLQVQLAINNVEGVDYPYLYCVLIAKKGAGLLDGYEEFESAPPQRSALGSLMTSLFGISAGAGGAGLVYEASTDGDVDIIVIRQYADKTSGWYTNPETAGYIVSSALEMAGKLFEKHGPARPAGNTAAKAA